MYIISEDLRDISYNIANILCFFNDYMNVPMINF